MGRVLLQGILMMEIPSQVNWHPQTQMCVWLYSPDSQTLSSYKMLTISLLWSGAFWPRFWFLWGIQNSSGPQHLHMAALWVFFTSFHWTSHQLQPPFYPPSPLGFSTLLLFCPSWAAHQPAVGDLLVFSFAFFGWSPCLSGLYDLVCTAEPQSWVSIPTLSVSFDSYQALTALDALAPAPVSKRTPSHALRRPPWVLSGPQRRALRSPSGHCCALPSLSLFSSPHGDASASSRCSLRKPLRGSQGPLKSPSPSHCLFL